ncbi:ATP-binding cassette sub-family A member 3 [Trichonephila clavata]|uniref:ATP-binding cassette sub-family A member 3 n=1 Tax=Trichonephila clavata TaxID=2740835 RepID=A0A8X6LHC5_TRICU|nr:ATP-binding cassette sub-family A member 3 [Trichonephila clavata]GFR10886.1 ATP-binding cassette sub-family A member 3 [Trichonephila clavata]
MSRDGRCYGFLSSLRLRQKLIKMFETTPGLRQFVILLYKGLLLRKRHYIVTFTEIVLPVLVACIPVIIMSELSSPKDDDYRPGKRSWIDYKTYEPFNPFQTPSRYRDIQFVFVPDSPVAYQFMNDSIETFRVNADHRSKLTSKGVKTEKELESYSLYQQRDDSDSVVIGTILKGFENDWPTSLDYKIRHGPTSYSSFFYTNLKYRVNGPSYMNAYTDTYFLSWQASVEETFIKRKMDESGSTNFTYKVWMQRFPYPEHKSNSISFSIVTLVPWVVGYGYLFFIINIVRRVIEEKANGSKELLKMMGMTDFTYWASTFMNYFISALITIFIITVIFKIPFKNGTVFMKNSEFFLTFIVLLLFMTSLILFCMLFSIFFKRPIFAIIALLVVYVLSLTFIMIVYFMKDTDLNYSSLSVGSKLGICLLPTGAFLTLFYLIGFNEASGEGLKWNNLTEFDQIPDLNILMVLGTMVFSCFLYIFAIWYFDAVWPWQPGVPKPFYFLFMPSYWCPSRLKDGTDVNLYDKNENSTEFFEEEPSSTTPGVIIQNLCKEFRSGLASKVAVNNVSLNIYRGQITALLGHNGAGKTTTINILTGLFTPTSGTASINGLDILADTFNARRGLGVCPQHNVLFDTLTVEEHLKIYAAMKGVQWGNLNAEITQVLNILKLSEKRNELIKNLSGGMKRKLSLGIAIVGGSKVLFLDEPTSGMDVEARRSVWDALLEIRHTRTIILTTHYMEEADILGDRIAIMAEGEIQCCGSPMYLKQKFGTGYHLHVVKNSDFDLQGLRSLLQKYIPEASIRNELEKEISFSLTSDTGGAFGDLFEELESKKQKLGVISFGITVTTMEDVFLNVANISDIKYKLRPETEQTNGVSITMENVYGGTPGIRPQPKFYNQFFGLLMKRIHYSKRNWSILIAQIVFPFLLICLCLYILADSGNKYRMTYDPLQLDISSVYGRTEGVFYNTKSELSELTETFKNVLKPNKITVNDVPDPTLYILDYGKKNLAGYLKNLLVGGALDLYANKTLNLTAWYNGEPYHATPMSLLLMHTAVLRHVTNTGTISLTNEPLPRLLFFVSNASTRMTAELLAITFLPLALSFLSASFVLLPLHERASKAKLLQLMTGIPSVMYWIAMFVWDYLIHIVVSILLIIPFAIFVHYAFFGMHSNAIGTALLMLFLYGWASIPFSYLVSLMFKKGGAGFSIIVGFCAILGVGLGSILRSVAYGLPNAKAEQLQKAVWVFRIFPTFSFAQGMSNLFGIAFYNAYCESVPYEDLQFNCYSSTMDQHNPLFKCCKNVCGDNCLKPENIFTWDKSACGRDLFFLFIDGCIYFSILLLLETRFMGAFFRAAKSRVMSLRKSMIGQIMEENINQDSDVLAEEERVRNLTATHLGTGGEALLVSGLTKVYRNFYAVNRLTFGIHPEECFGLLGVNGAGKTTTFRMLTGDTFPTEGNAMTSSSSIWTDMDKFQSQLGYCPQFDALIDRLTGREMLSLFARLRGLTGFDLDERVNTLIRMTDLVPHADKQTQFYSGGSKRKLSVAISLIGAPPLILLDEPTAGVDPVSRRKIWNILSQARNNTGAAVILTTHSMEESEALCSRLAIMVNGRLQCLGSIQQLKSKYGQGYTIIIKMKKEHQDNQEAVNAIKTHIQSNLPGANLKDEHQGMVQYHVVDPSISLSRLFKFMSSMKNQFELEDYLISDTSLEQIFLTFARAQRIMR